MPSVPTPPSFNAAGTYLYGTSAQLDENGEYTLPRAIAASAIIGIEDYPPTYDLYGNEYSQVNVLVAGQSLGFVNANYTTLRQTWQVVAAAYNQPSSTPADLTNLEAAVSNLEALEPPQV